MTNSSENVKFQADVKSLMDSIANDLHANALEEVRFHSVQDESLPDAEKDLDASLWCTAMRNGAGRATIGSWYFYSRSG